MVGSFSPIVTVAITAPTILYLTARISFIVFRKRHALRHHVSHGGLALATHIVGGTALLATTPYLAWLCHPPQADGGGYAVASLSKVQRHRLPLLFLSSLLVYLNLGVLPLLPHPLLRHREYKATQRIATRAVALMAVNAVQFAVMALGPVAILSRHDGFAACAFAMVALGYAATSVVCYCEMRNVAWEESAPGRFLLTRIVVGRGPAVRSTLVANTIQNPGDGRGIFVILFFVGVLAMVQSVWQCRHFALAGSERLRPPDPGLEDFFVAMLTYTTAVMSASFFSFSQFDPTTTSEQEYLREVLLGIALPTIVTALGPWWMSAGSTGLDFLWQWTFWTGAMPW